MAKYLFENCKNRNRQAAGRRGKKKSRSTAARGGGRSGEPGLGEMLQSAPNVASSRDARRREPGGGGVSR
ncbi:hypothetical protein CXQ84_24095 [Burkholderia pseudomallei]|nr:hypothetical protein CXQ84_24095 [Burkholderia pseudomallei]